jgi:hypothetical protein
LICLVHNLGKQINLINVRIGDKGFDFFQQVASQLDELILQNNGITSCGLEWMLPLNIKKLQRLWLGRNRIGQSGAKYLTKIDLPELKYLNLSNILNILADCSLSESSFNYLVKGNWKKLEELTITSNKKVRASVYQYWALQHEALKFFKHN